MPETKRSQTVLPDRNRVIRVTDGAGRVLGVRRLGILQRLRLYEAVGPDNVRNEHYMGHALIAAAVVEIDGEPCEPIASKRQLEARVRLLDDHGMIATDEALTEDYHRAVAESPPPGG